MRRENRKYVMTRGRRLVFGSHKRAQNQPLPGCSGDTGIFGRRANGSQCRKAPTRRSGRRIARFCYSKPPCRKTVHSRCVYLLAPIATFSVILSGAERSPLERRRFVRLRSPLLSSPRITGKICIIWSRKNYETVVSRYYGMAKTQEKSR